MDAQQNFTATKYFLLSYLFGIKGCGVLLKKTAKVSLIAIVSVKLIE